MSARIHCLCLIFSCSLGIAFAQFSTGFPFNMIPGGLRIPFIGGTNNAGGLNTMGTLGSGLGSLGGQGGWGQQAAAIPAPIQTYAAPVQSGWNSAQPVQQLVRPVIQPAPMAASSGWGSQQPLARPVVIPAAQPVQSGWGSQQAAPVVVPQAAPVVTAPLAATNSGWGSQRGFGAV